eukprot:2523121-Pleurochrysis_carterae.AAC.2
MPRTTRVTLKHTATVRAPTTSVACARTAHALALLGARRRRTRPAQRRAQRVALYDYAYAAVWLPRTGLQTRVLARSAPSDEAAGSAPVVDGQRTMLHGLWLCRRVPGSGVFPANAGCPSNCCSTSVSQRECNYKTLSRSQGSLSKESQNA